MNLKLLKESGFAELPTVIILSLIILAIGIGLMVRVSTETEMRKTSLSSQESFYLSDSGVDDALLKITRNKLAEPKGVSAFSTSSLRVGISMEGTSTTVSTSTIFSLSKLKGEYKDIKTIIEVSEYGKINTTTASWRQAITKGTFVGALNFDGTDDYVNIPDSNIFDTQTFTVSFWAKSNSISRQSPVDKWWDSSIRQWDIVFNNEAVGRIDFYIGYSSGFKMVQYIDDRIYDGNWHFYTFTMNNGVIKIWIEGVEKASVSTGYTMLYNTAPVYIGKCSYGEGQNFLPFKGLIDEVRIYNRALSPTEIAEHYQGVFKDETGLVGYWSFDKVESNGTVLDKSGQGNTGTLKPTYPTNCPAFIE